MEIRRFQRGDEEAISKLHNATVRAINSKDYTSKEIQVWSPIRENHEKMAQSLEANISYVAIINGEIVGFGDISSQGHIKRLYTHKDHQGKGIGSNILRKLEEEAKGLGLKEINLESTITARSFYEAKGYECLGKTIVKFQGIPTEDWKMRKRI